MRIGPAPAAKWVPPCGPAGHPSAIILIQGVGPPPGPAVAKDVHSRDGHRDGGASTGVCWPTCHANHLASVPGLAGCEFSVCLAFVAPPFTTAAAETRRCRRSACPAASPAPARSGRAPPAPVLTTAIRRRTARRRMPDLAEVDRDRAPVRGPGDAPEVQVVSGRIAHVEEPERQPEEAASLP